MIKVVPDSNIILSGMIGHNGNPRKIINLALAKKIVLYGSQETYEEFVEKIHRSKFKKYLQNQIFTPEKIILDYKSIITMVEPFDILAGVSIVKEDPDDDMLFRAAKSAGVRIIISGDKAVLGVKKYDGIVVVSPAKFVESFSKIKHSEDSAS